MKKKTICVQCKYCVKEQLYDETWFGRKTNVREYIRCEDIDPQTGEAELYNAEDINKGNCSRYKKGVPRILEVKRDNSGSGMFDF